MSCEPDTIGPTCQVPMFPRVGETWTCPKCGLTWTADTYWRTAS